MPVFKTFFKILKQKRLSLLIALGISFGVSLMILGSVEDPGTEAFKISENKVLIVNHDTSGEIAANLTKYIKENATIVEMENDKKAIQDALFFEKIDYVITIPNGFTEKIQSGEKEKLEVQTKPNTFSQTMMNTFLNNYLTTYQNYQQLFPDKTSDELLKLTNEAVQTKGTVYQDSSYAENNFNQGFARVFDLLSYGLFSFILQGIAFASLTFNRKVIQLRNSCSPFSKRKITKQFFLATLVFTIFALAIFSSYLLYFANFNITTHLLYFFVNTLAFLLAIVSFSIFVSGLIVNEDMIVVINNIMILGSCFLGGVFVPSQYLPSFVTNIAAFTPTYWFTQSNHLVGTAAAFTETFYNDWFQKLFILLIFSLVFLLLSIITRRERGGLKKMKLSL